MREALKALGEGLADYTQAFGSPEETDPLRRLIGAAGGWGGNPDAEAMYVGITPAGNDGKTVYRLNLKDVPVDGFWSISVYNAAGFFEPNDRDAYSLNSVTARKDPDGSVTVQFGDCDGANGNCLPTPPGWNGLARLYRPRAEIRDGSWTFPRPRPVA